MYILYIHTTYLHRLRKARSSKLLFMATNQETCSKMKEEDASLELETSKVLYTSFIHVRVSAYIYMPASVMYYDSFLQSLLWILYM